MSDVTTVRTHRLRELVLALCAAWLLIQNMILFVLIAWGPLTGIRIATLTLLRVALHAATPVTVLPGGGLLGITAALLGLGMGAHHV